MAERERERERKTDEVYSWKEIRVRMQSSAMTEIANGYLHYNMCPVAEFPFLLLVIELVFHNKVDGNKNTDYFSNPNIDHQLCAICRSIQTMKSRL